MPGPYAAFGSKLQIDTGSTAVVWTDVGCLRNIDGPNSSLETIDATCHDSTGSFRVKRASFIDGGQVTADYLYDPNDTGHKAIHTTWSGRVLEDFRIGEVSSTATFVTFSAFVSELGKSRPFEDMLGGSATLEISGAVAYTT